MSIKQDGARVRTAHDLEQKYNLPGMKKAFELRENTITRINQILQDFVNIVIGTLDNFEGLEDGNVTTYFYNGTPTLENAPANEWTNYDLHINDLYYDRDTGKAYIFSKVDEVYLWEETTNKEKIKVLALANATKDTEDNKRRIFVEQPLPPYENGDLWVKDGEIYICQISKPETEVFETHDFIVLSDYGGDTLAIKAGKDLVVLKGTVLKITEDAELLRVSLENLDTMARSEIELLQNQLKTLIVDSNGESMMTQTTDGWQFEISGLVETVDSTSNKVNELEEGVNKNNEDLDNVKNSVVTVEEKTAYMNVKMVDGKPWLELGAEDSNFKLILTNEEILFAEGSNYPAYMNNDTMFIRNAKIENEIQIATMTWIKRANGHVSFMPKGVI